MKNNKMEDIIDLLYPVSDYIHDPLLVWVIEGGKEDKSIFQHLYAGAGGRGLPKNESINKLFKK